MKLTTNQITAFNALLAECKASEIWDTVVSYSNEITDSDTSVDVRDAVREQLCVIADGPAPVTSMKLTTNQITEFKARLTQCDASEIWGEVKAYSNEITDFGVFIDVLEDLQDQLCAVAETAKLRDDSSDWVYTAA